MLRDYTRRSESRQLHHRQCCGCLPGSAVDPLSWLRWIYQRGDDQFAPERLEPDPDRDRNSVCRRYRHGECLYVARVFRTGRRPDAPASHLRTSDVHVGAGHAVRRWSGLSDVVVSEIDGTYARGKGSGVIDDWLSKLICHWSSVIFHLSLAGTSKLFPTQQAHDVIHDK